MNTKPEQQHVPQVVADRIVNDVQNNIHHQPCDTRRWSRQRRYDEYKKLAKIAPELWYLYRDAVTLGDIFKAFKVSGEAIDEAWYHAGFKQRVVDLVGHARLFTTDQSLSGMRAYDIVYQTIIDVLHEPDLFANVTKGERKLTSYSASDLVNAPYVSPHRVGDDLIIANWFHKDAVR